MKLAENDLGWPNALTIDYYSDKFVVVVVFVFVISDWLFRSPDMFHVFFENRSLLLHLVIDRDSVNFKKIQKRTTRRDSARNEKPSLFCIISRQSERSDSVRNEETDSSPSDRWRHCRLFWGDAHLNEIGFMDLNGDGRHHIPAKRWQFKFEFPAAISTNL